MAKRFFGAGALLVSLTLIMSGGAPSATAGPAPRESAAATCSHPSDILNLTNWKLTMAADHPGASGIQPWEILQPRLDTWAWNPYFTMYTNCVAVRFRAPVNGATTSGSSYPRTGCAR